ncbi:OsmC family peroxiredoxin, partial [Pseudomonas sp. FSL R10-0399]
LGATPQELLLAGIGNCLAATYIGGLSASGVKVNSLVLDVSGRVDFRAAFGVTSGNPGFESIQVQVLIDTEESSERVDALLAKLLPTAPIPDTIMRPVPLTVEVQHTG